MMDDTSRFLRKPVPLWLPAPTGFYKNLILLQPALLIHTAKGAANGKIDFVSVK